MVDILNIKVFGCQDLIVIFLSRQSFAYLDSSELIFKLSWEDLFNPTF